MNLKSKIYLYLKMNEVYDKEETLTCTCVRKRTYSGCLR